MATFMVAEERGTYSGHRHPHNGSCAGDFGTQSELPAWRPEVERAVRVTVHRSEAGHR